MNKSSKNFTSFLLLNQWEGEDYPERVDFVGDNKKIDDFAIETNQEISNLKSEKANTADVTQSLKNKADKQYVEDNMPKIVGDLSDGSEYAKKSEINGLVDTSGINKSIKELQDTKADITTMNNELKNKSQVGHVHDERYALKGHTHSQYASSLHDHDKQYSKLGHNHNDKYALTVHTHNDLYSRLNHTHSEYSLTNHNHNSEYASITHTHDTRYAMRTHRHKWSEIDEKPNSFNPSTHYHSEYATNKDFEKLFQSGVESNKNIVEALNSMKITASTDDSIAKNTKKLNDTPKHSDKRVLLRNQYEVVKAPKGLHDGTNDYKVSIYNLNSSTVPLGLEIGGIKGTYEGEIIARLPSEENKGNVISIDYPYRRTGTHTVSSGADTNLETVYKGETHKGSFTVNFSGEVLVDSYAYYEGGYEGSTATTRVNVNGVRKVNHVYTPRINHSQFKNTPVTVNKGDKIEVVMECDKGVYSSSYHYIRMQFATTKTPYLITRND